MFRRKVKISSFFTGELFTAKVAGNGTLWKVVPTKVYISINVYQEIIRCRRVFKMMLIEKES